jgi:hypothetical protein
MQTKPRRGIEGLFLKVCASQGEGSECPRRGGPIKGLRIGPFAAHLAREKSTSMQELYNELEKYCKSDNDLRKRLEEQNQNKQQENNKNTQRNNASQGQHQQKQDQS